MPYFPRRTGRGVHYCVCSKQAPTSAVATADLQLLQPGGLWSWGRLWEICILGPSSLKPPTPCSCSPHPSAGESEKPAHWSSLGKLPAFLQSPTDGNPTETGIPAKLQKLLDPWRGQDPPRTGRRPGRAAPTGEKVRERRGRGGCQSPPLWGQAATLHLPFLLPGQKGGRAV